MRKCIECDHLDLDWDQYPCDICDRETLSEWKGDGDDTTALRLELADAAIEYAELLGEEPVFSCDSTNGKWWRWSDKTNKHNAKLIALAKQIKGE